MAVNKETLEDLLKNRTENMPIGLIHVFGVCPFIALYSICLIVVIMLTLYTCAGKPKKKPKLNRQRKSVTLSIALVSCSRLIFFIFLDFLAIHARDSTLDSDLKEIFYVRKFGEYHDLLYQIPTVLVTLDILSFSVLLFLVVFAVKQKCVSRGNSNGYQLLQSLAEDNAIESETWKDNKHYYTLALTGLCLLFSVLLHSPYIATAYLNDAQHAGSIFIFYASLTFVEFGLLQFSFNRCLEADDGQTNRESLKRKILTKYFGLFSAFITPLLLYGLTVVIMLYFYFVPTNDSISSVPNQMVVSYQTAILFIGAYIAYTSVFKKKCSLQTALRETHDNWRSLTDQEVLTEFYKDVISKSDEIASKQKEIAIQNKINNLWHKHDRESEESKKDEISAQITALENELNGQGATNP